MAAITAIGAGLRFATLDLQSFWFDEAFTVVQLRWPFHDMLSRLDQFQATPPLYYVIASPWTALFGDGEVGIRSLSALCGTAAVPVSFAAAARLASARAGLIAAALMAVSPVVVWYSQEARPYALLTLLSALSLLLFARALDSERMRELVAWATVSCLAVATHYFAAFLVVPAGMWLVARSPGRRTGPLVATGVVIAASVALLPLALTQRSNGRGDYIADLPLKDRLSEVGKQLIAGPSLAPGQGLALLALLIVLGGLALLVLRTRGRERTGGLLALGLAATTIGTPVLMALAGYNYLLVRNVIAGWVPLAVAVGAGLAGARLSRVGAVVLTCAFGAIVILVAFNPGFQRDDWRTAARDLDRRPADRAVVISPGYSSSPALLYLRQAYQPPDLSQQLPVKEIVLLGTGPARPFDLRHGPAGPLRLVSARRVQHLGVGVLRLERERQLSPRQLERGGIASAAGGVLFQRAPEPGR